MAVADRAHDARAGAPVKSENRNMWGVSRKAHRKAAPRQAHINVLRLSYGRAARAMR